MDNAFGFLLILVLLLWEIGDNPLTDKTTLYFRDSICLETSSECIETMGRVTFNVSSDSQIVTGISHRQSAIPFRLRDCVIVDKENWECQGYFNNEPIGRTNGDWVLSDDYESYWLKSVWWISNLIN